MPARTFPAPSMARGPWEVSSIRGADLGVLILVPVSVILLIWFLDRTMIGKTVKACATNPSLARLSSISPKLVSTMVWALAAVLSTLSVILIAGESSTAAGLATLGPQTLSEALAAAVIAGMRSFRVAVIAAVVIGVLQSLLTYNFLAVPGITDLLLFIAVFIAVIFAKREQRRGSGFRLQPAGTPHSRAPPLLLVGSQHRQGWHLVAGPHRRTPPYPGERAVPPAALHRGLGLRDLCLLADGVDRMAGATLAGSDGVRRTGCPVRSSPGHRRSAVLAGHRHLDRGVRPACIGDRHWFSSRPWPLPGRRDVRLRVDGAAVLLFPSFLLRGLA